MKATFISRSHPVLLDFLLNTANPTRLELKRSMTEASGTETVSVTISNLKKSTWNEPDPSVSEMLVWFKLTTPSLNKEKKDGFRDHDKVSTKFASLLSKLFMKLESTNSPSKYILFGPSKGRDESKEPVLRVRAAEIIGPSTKNDSKFPVGQKEGYVGMSPGPIRRVSVYGASPGS